MTSNVRDAKERNQKIAWMKENGYIDGTLFVQVIGRGMLDRYLTQLERVINDRKKRLAGDD